MRLSALPPVRRAVPLARGNSDSRRSMEKFFGDRRITVYASGTAALARAIANCAAQSPASAPEVIIPAYGCPDLVAACLHASVRPRLVDVAPSHWSYDLDALQASLTRETVAIVAVNLLGIGDGSTELAALCRTRGIPLIQDSAQHLPRQMITWPGDYVVLSFGRGKPLNLLHGGALIESRATPCSSAIDPVTARYTLKDRLLASRLAAVSFNILTRPHAYRLFSALPGTNLGQVTYEPLSNPAPLPERAWDQLGIAFQLYRQSQSYRRDIWAASLDQWKDMGIQELDCLGSRAQTEPLRLALLAPERTARNTLVSTLNAIGLGASLLYGSDLTRVAGIPDAVTRQGPFPNAANLADRLFTLPTHNLLNTVAVERARRAVLAWHQYSSHTG